MQEQSRARFPALGAVLSFLFPGLGQLYSGQPTIAAILAAPVLLVVAGGMAAYLLVADRLQSALFNTQFLTTLLGLDLRPRSESCGRAPSLPLPAREPRPPRRCPNRRRRCVGVGGRSRWSCCW